MSLLITILFVYLLFLLDFKITYTNGYSKHEIIYVGLLWVIFDYYDLFRYESTNKPKKWIDYELTKNNY